MIWEKKVPIVLSFLVFFPLDLVRSIKYWQKTRFVPPPWNSGFFRWKVTPIGLKWDTNHPFWVVSDWVTGVLFFPIDEIPSGISSMGKWGGRNLGTSTPVGAHIWSIQWPIIGDCKLQIWVTKSEGGLRKKNTFFVWEKGVFWGKLTFWGYKCFRWGGNQASQHCLHLKRK